jgi:pyridoxine 4-dehydrogenase
LSRYPLTSGLVEQAKELGVQLIGYSPLALGLLTDKYSIEKNR